LIVLGKCSILADEGRELPGSLPEEVDMKDPERRPRWQRWMPRVAASAALVVAITSASTVVASASSSYPTLNVVNVRVGPGTHAPILYQIPKGQFVSIDCYTTGELVSGTTIWNRLSGTGGYITDSLLLTGSHAPVVPECASGGGEVSAQDPATCQAEGCSRLDPQQTTCVQDAQTLMSWEVTIDGSNYGHLEMRYSAKCHSNWVRFVPTSGLRGFLGNWFGGSIHSTPAIWREGHTESRQGLADRSAPSAFGDPTSWTRMVNADGTTCGAVALVWTEPSTSGQDDRTELGTFEAPCVS
jgi:uncharacterized protein YraI